MDWIRYFEVVLQSVQFNQSERIVSYSMPYFRKLGLVLQATDKR